MKSIISICFATTLSYLSAQGLCSTTEFNGSGTYYAASGTPSCSFEASVIDDHYAAMNAAQFNNADYCGTCLEITGQVGTTIVQIIDECATCPANNIDMSPIAFTEAVGDLMIGTGAISWKQVSCPWTTNLKLNTFSSSPWYCSVVIENHVNDLSAVQLFANGTWNSLTRTNYNSWTNNGFSLNGESSYDFRVTDCYGQTINITGVDLGGAQQIYQAMENFIPCSNLGINPKNQQGFLLKETNEHWAITAENGIKSVQLLDQTGKILMDGMSQSDEIVLSKNNIASGVYFIQVQSENGQLARFKVLR